MPPRPLAEARALLGSGAAVQVTGLAGSAPAFVAAACAPDAGAPLLWIAPSGEAAEASFADLRFYFGDPGTGTPLLDPAGAGRRVVLYPDWDVEPYTGLSPHVDVARRRIEVLYALLAGHPLVVVASVAAVSKRVLPRDALAGAAVEVRRGEELPRGSAVRRLVDGGYLSTDRTEERGCFSVRGHILDVFAPLYPVPLRLESWGDAVESIRPFDPYSQRSAGAPRDEAVLLPVREEMLTEAALAKARAALAGLTHERDLPPRHRIALTEQLERGCFFSGIEAYLPLFHDRLETLFDFLGPGAAVVVEHPDAAREGIERGARRRAAAFAQDLGEEHLVPPPEALFLSPEELEAALAHRPRLLVPLAVPDEGIPTVEVRAQELSGLRSEILQAQGNEEGMLVPLVERVRKWQKDKLKVVVGCRSRVQASQVGEILAPYKVKVETWERRPPPGDLLDPASGLRTSTGVLSALPATPGRGFAAPALGVAVVADVEVFGRRARARGPAARALRAAFASFSELQEGDAVVHARHGIGLYRGLHKLAVGKSENDYLLLEYQGGDRLYVPVHQLDQLSRWAGPEGSRPAVDKLGGTTWRTRKRKAEEAVQKLARELLDLYATRALSRRRSFPPPDEWVRELESSFPFDETEDQLEAIAAVRADLASDRPMDRLLCGDVGFGKTEVAMRAAAQVAASGRQVAVLVPTTILALQHYASFTDRMSALPLRVAMLSRFVEGAEERRVVAELADGRVDVVIGTHRLLSEDIAFRDLGMLVIDEEHRFGVQHKERIKRLRRDVDVLTMTATPIPRTLNMAMAGLRDLSLITTPPTGRQGVRTHVARFSEARVKEAIEAELRRGGQVFFVHNRVKSIHALGRFLERLMPGLRLRVAHGQMPARQLEDIMLEFVQRRFDVLLCTTIIESGIDIPNANTILVHRADAYGLAQLYQLRGRVGRARAKGQAWLLVPPGHALHADALKRLKVIEEHSDLGAGLRVASHDLEMRGAGDLLGRSQHGHIAAVGFETYMEMLDDAVRHLKGEGKSPDAFETEVEFSCEAYIPSDYVPDQRDRLLYYKRLSAARAEGEALSITEELEDLYGRVPEPVERLVDLIRVKVAARKLKITRMKGAPSGVELHFDPETPVAAGRFARLVQDNPQRLALSPAGVLTVRTSKEERRDPLPLLKKVLARLA